MAVEPTVTVTEAGTRRWRVNGQLHRTDGPAVEYANGDRGWYVNGLLHRTDGPAIQWVDGDCSWYLNGLHYTFREWLNKLDEPTRLLMILKYGT